MTPKLCIFQMPLGFYTHDHTHTQTYFYFQRKVMFKRQVTSPFRETKVLENLDRCRLSYISSFLFVRKKFGQAL